MQHSPHEHCKSVVGLEPGDHNASAPTGAAIDCLGFREAKVVLAVATVAGTSPTLDVKVQSSDASGGTYADISGAAFTQVTTANDEKVFVGRIHLQPQQRWLKVVATHGGTHTESSYCCVVELSEYRKPPVTQSETVAFNVTS